MIKYNLDIFKNFTSIEKVCKVLCVNKVLKYNIINNNIKECYITEINDNGREIHKPMYFLKKSQKKLLKCLLPKVLPKYLFAPSIKNTNKNNIENARYHLGKKYFLTMDISSFYNSIKGNIIYDLFFNKFKLNSDVALFITKLTVYDNGEETFLSTGSPSSQILAYLCYSDVFDNIYNLCLKKGIRFSLYVDDMTFSSDIKFTNKLPNKIIDIFEKNNLKIKPEKTKRYNKGYAKITGVILKNNKLYIKNSKRKDIIENLKLLNKSNDIIKKEIENNNIEIIKTISKLNGLLNYTKQIEEDHFLANRNRIRKLYKLIPK
ncbi:reverse transcriptase family protein [uncultured Brachyspira sp.]|uniref:reverse transcriptase family protein n=4 Tax=uncultured Brachyspira sp. TaxID=221953 RepID=UPI0025E32713|nr:reverse transcriptase family protein [uncultured Brachyspira sp.]